MLKRALRLVQVTFDVHMPERLAHSASLFTGAPVLRVAGSTAWAARQESHMRPAGWQGPLRSKCGECGAARGQSLSTLLRTPAFGAETPS